MPEIDKEALFNELQMRFYALQYEFERLDRESETLITHWHFAERSAFELRVEFYRRFNVRPGILEDSESLMPSGYYGYGYDAQERIVCAGHYPFLSRDLPDEYTFYEYHDDRIDLAGFILEPGTENYHLLKVGRLVKPSGQNPLCYAEYNLSEKKSRLFEKYFYDDRDRISRISVWPHEENFEYEGDRLQRIVWQSRRIIRGTESWAPERVLYDYDYDGDTKEENAIADTLFHEARAALYTKVIYSLVEYDREKRRHTRFYNLELYYDAISGDGVLLHLGEVAQREAWEKKTKEWLYSSLFYDAVDWHREHIQIAHLPKEYQLFLDTCRRDKGFDAIRDLYYAVARDLNDFNWAGILDTTEDFIAFAIDYEAMVDGVVHDEIWACVPEYKLRILRSKGLLK